MTFNICDDRSEEIGRSVIINLRARAGQIATKQVNPASDRVMPTPNKHRGVTLIEAMISLVILAMGLLGLAALQGLGTKFGNKAYFRSQAITQAYDIFDRMRANPGGTPTIMFETPCPTVTAATTVEPPRAPIPDLATYDLVVLEHD